MLGCILFVGWFSNYVEFVNVVTYRVNLTLFALSSVLALAPPTLFYSVGEDLKGWSFMLSSMLYVCLEGYSIRIYTSTTYTNVHTHIYICTYSISML